MEVWILLAAAGSGYLARCWQNSQKAKGVVAEEDNDTAVSSSQPSRPIRGKYRHFSNSGRHAGKLLCGKGNPQWIRQSPRSTQVPANTVGETSSENKAEPKGSNVEDRNMLQEGGKSYDSFSQSDTDLKSKDVTCAGALNKSISENNCTFSENSGGSLHLSEDLSSRQTQGAINEGWESGGASGPVLSRSSSGKRTSDLSRGPRAIGGNSAREAGSGKRMKDATISPATTQDEAFVFGGSWMPGFWDVSEGVFVLDADSLLAQQGEVVRSKDCSSRKIKTPRKHARSRGSTSRRKNLVIQKPMSSLESCLSAQLDKEYSAAGSLSSFCSSTSGENKLLMDHLEKNVDSQFGPPERRELNETVNYAIGLPPLSKKPTRSSKQRTLRHSSGRSSKSDITRSSVAGSTEITWKGLLFNFGVGVGMMFTVLSNMREVKRLTMLLREAECLIKDLENELEGRETLKVCDFKATPEKGDVVETRQTAVVNTLYKVRSASQILNSMRVSLTDESLPIGNKQSKDMAKLEAELEAELERMELSLNVGNPLNHSVASDFETEVAGSLVQGELSVSGLPCGTGLDSEDDEGSDSLHDDFHVSNYAVSPRELSRRLHEVLEVRQEERILELEAELQLMRKTLQTKEDEIQLRGKKGFTHDERERCVGDAYTKAGRDSQNFSPSDEKDFPSSIQLHSKKLQSLSFHDSPNASPISQGHVATQDMDGLFRMNKGSKMKDRTAFITLGGDALDAYNEACKEFSKVSGDATGLGVDTDHKFPHKLFEDSMPKDIDQVNLAPDHYWEQVDLLSLAEDFCSGDGCEINEGMPRFSNISSKRRPIARRRNSRHKCNHPEPEQTCANLKAVDSSDETADTSGSTPCSIKFMDVRTVGCGHSNNQSGAEVLNDAIPFPEWHQEVLFPAGANTPNKQEKQFIYSGQEVLEALGSPGQHGSTSSPGEWTMAGGNDDSQDLDDQLGQLLIKRIVEKSRRGSPIIQDAQTVLASFERINIV